MFKRLLTAAVFLAAAVTALAANGPSYGGNPPKNPASQGILETNLATNSGQFRGGRDGARYHDSWVAFDYTPTTRVTVTTFRHHYMYNSAPLKNQLNFQLIRGQNPRVGSVVATWAVPAASWDEINTGWTAFGRTVYLCVVPFTPGRNLAASQRYWFAYQSENDRAPNMVYWVYRADSIKGEMWWQYLNGRWQSASEYGYPGDMSYRLDGGFTGVTPASLGKVKALYR